MTKECDSDTLQILDESDTEWVELWRNATRKKVSHPSELTITVISPEEPLTKPLQTKTRT